MTDVTAQEALRSMLADTIENAVYGPGGDDEGTPPDVVAGALIGQFPDVEWEFTTNEHGVRVRRLSVKGGWLVDLTVAEQAEQVRNTGRLAPHEFVHATHRGRFVLECGHFEQAGGQPARECGRVAGDPVHVTGPDHSPGSAGVLPGITCTDPEHCPR